MKIKNISLFILAFGCFISNAQDTKSNAKIKRTFQASYSAKRTAEMPRDSAFKSNYFERYDSFDINGKHVEYGQYDGRGSIYELTKIERDNHGKPKKGRIYGPDGNLKKYYITEIDSIGNVTEINNYNSEDELVYVQKNVYDMNGNVLTRTSTQIKSNRVNKTTLKYNDKNEMIQRITFLPDGTIKDTRTFVYDESGNEIESDLLRSNGEYKKFVSEYDKFNNLILQNWFDQQGNLEHQTSFEYNYDRHGNWITKKRFSNEKLGFVWHRKIEYYK